MKKFRALGYLISLSLVVIACKTIPQSNVVSQPEPTQSQIIPYTDLIQHPDCSFPCWNGIEVDKTSFSSAKEILVKRYGTANVENFGERNLTWKAHDLDGMNDGYIGFSEGIVAEMLITFNNGSELTVGDLVAVFGEPTWVFVSSQPNNVCRRFDVIYPTLGLYGYLNTSEEQKNIQPSNQIMILRFVQTKLSENRQIYDGYLLKWDGYKKYCET